MTSTLLFQKLVAQLEGHAIEDCQDAAVNLMASVIVQFYRAEGLTLDQALELADAASSDVKACIRTNWCPGASRVAQGPVGHA